MLYEVITGAARWCGARVDAGGGCAAVFALGLALVWGHRYRSSTPDGAN